MTCIFFFQAEDGIRDHCVTGVQTCALPISIHPPWMHRPSLDRRRSLESLEGDSRVELPPEHANYVGLPLVCCAPRSEEHTSELQSHSDLVCRLLLEKKKNK